MKYIYIVLLILEFLLFSFDSFTQNFFSGLSIYCNEKYISLLPTEKNNQIKLFIEDNLGRNIDSLYISKTKSKNDTFCTSCHIVYDDKLIRYFNKLQRKSLRYSCTSYSLDYPGIYELNSKEIDYTVFQIIFYKNKNCNIIRYQKRDLRLYSKIDFRFIFILNTVNKIKKQSLKYIK